MKTIVHIGDSNTIDISWRSAYEREWLAKGGVFECAQSYNLGMSGSRIADWGVTGVAQCDDPAYSSLPPFDFVNTFPGHGALARAINANPTHVFVCLGTNDQNSPANRAGAGTEPTMRANLTALVDLLKERTSAQVHLIIPQPLAHEDFMGITQWADADDAAQASARVRKVYLEFVGQSRVTVHDTHRLFGVRCDDKATQAQDPHGMGPLIQDSLHRTVLGHRRIAQMIARDLCAGYPTPLVQIEPNAIPKNAVWSVSLFCRNAPLAVAPGAPGHVAFDVSPAAAIGGFTTERATIGDAGFYPPLSKKPLIELSPALGRLSAFREFMAIPKKGKVKAYSHATGVTTDLTNYVISQFVSDPGGGEFVQMQLAGPALAGFGGGLVTFYVSDPTAVPFASRLIVATTMHGAQKHFSFPVLGDAANGGETAYGGAAVRSPTADLAVVTLYHQNQGDGRYVYGATTYAAPGWPVGTFTFAPHQNRAALVFDPGYPDGINLVASNAVLFAKLTSGALPSGCDLMLTR